MVGVTDSIPVVPIAYKSKNIQRRSNCPVTQEPGPLAEALTQNSGSLLKQDIELKNLEGSAEVTVRAGRDEKWHLFLKHID